MAGEEVRVLCALRHSHIRGGEEEEEGKELESERASRERAWN